MKITINLNTKEVTMIKTLAKKFKGQIIDPIKNQIMALIGHETETEEKKERIKARIRTTYENTMVVTSESWENGLNASLEIKTNFLEKVFDLASRIIDEAAPSMGAIMGATMIFAGFIKSSAKKISSFVEKVKKDEQKDMIVTNNIFYPNDHTVVNCLIAKNRFGYCDHIAWITESSDELSTAEELKLVEMIEVAIETGDYSGLRTHYVANSFDNKDEALEWFKDHNKVTTEYNTVCHGNGWTVKDWGKESKESTETEAKTENEGGKTPSEMACDAIRNYNPDSDNIFEADVAKLEKMLEELKDLVHNGKQDEIHAHIKKMRAKYDELDQLSIELPMESYNRIQNVRYEANRLIDDSDQWLGW